MTMNLEDLFRNVRSHDREIRALKARRETVLSTGGGGSGIVGSPLGVTIWENQSGGTRSQGYVVVSSGDRLFDDTTTVGDPRVIGVLDDDAIQVGANGRVRHIGYQRVVNVQGAVVAGNYLRTSATAGSAEDAGGVMTAGCFAIALTAAAGPGAGQVAAYVMAAPLDSSVHIQTYLRVGSVSAPLNTTAGDLTAIRASVGDSTAFAATVRSLDVNGTWNPTGTTELNLGSMSAILTPSGAGLASDEHRTLRLTVTVRPTANWSGQAIGTRYTASHDSGAFNVGPLYGFWGEADQAVAATTASAVRGAHAVYRAIAGTITEAEGLLVTRGVAGDAGAITTGYGIRVFASAGAIPSTDIGLSIEGAGAHSRFQGSVVIGAAASPAAATVGLYLTQLMAQSGTAINVGVDGTAPRLVMGAMDGTNEGGEIILNGAAANIDWTWDNNAGSLRWFESGQVRMLLAPTTHGLRVAGYGRYGSVSAPTNTTAGDLTCIRLKVGDGAFGTGVEFSVTGDGALSGFLRVGSETAPTNTTAGDVTALRAVIGEDRALAAILHVVQPTLGNEAFRVESTATNDDPSERVFQNRAATTDATVTTLHSFTIPASTTFHLTVWVTARRTGGAAGTAEDGAGYMIAATIKNVAGTATLIGAVNQLVVQEDQAAWDATIDVTAATARVRVTGALDNNVTWHMTARVHQVSS